MDIQNFIETKSRELSRKLAADFAEKLRQYFLLNLLHLGYEFNTNEEFLEFFVLKVTRVSFEANPELLELYINYKDENNRGVFIGSYSTKVNVTQEGYTVKATIG